MDTVTTKYLAMTKLKPPMKLSEMDRCLDNLDIQPILKSKVRRVKWLYNNNNKLTMVYEERLVRLIVHRMQERINHLEMQMQLTPKSYDTLYQESKTK